MRRAWMVALATLAVTGSIVACGPGGATSASSSGGGPSSPACDWAKEYDQLPPGMVMGGAPAPPVDAGAE
jgi:hypothetical protein